MADTIDVLLKIHKAIKDLSRQNNTNSDFNFNASDANIKALESMNRESEKLARSVKSAAEYQRSFLAAADVAADKMKIGNKVIDNTILLPLRIAYNTVGLVDKALGGIGSKTLKFLGKTFGGINSKVKNLLNATAGWGKALISSRNPLKILYVLFDGIASLLGGILKTAVEITASIISLSATVAKTLINAFTAATTAAAKFAKFLFTLPIGIANRVSVMGGQLRQELVEVIGQAVENTKELFDLASNGGQAFKRLGGIAKGSLLTFQSVNSTMTKLFGYGAAGAAKMVADVTKNIGDMGLFADIFADSTTKSGKSIEFITRMTRGMAMGADDLNYVVREAMKNGEHYFETMTRMKLASDAASREFGVNRKLLSKNFFQLRKDITQFGHLSDIELMRVAGRATQLGVEMKDLAGVFNKFGTFEDAANSAALLSQTFGMNIDALQLIRAEDPMEIVEMFRNSMLATGRSFDDLNRHEKSLMATHTGMSVEALKTTMNYRTLGKSYEDIKKIMNDQKPEERQIRAMKDMRSSMSEIQKIMDKKDFFTAFTDGLSKTILYNTKLGDSFVSINKKMEDFYENGLKLTREQKGQLDDVVAPFAGIVNQINDVFSIDKLNTVKKFILENLSKFIVDITSVLHPDCVIGNKFTEIRHEWESKFANFFDLSFILKDKGFFASLARVSGKIIGYILRSFVILGPSLIKGIGSAISQAIGFFKGDNAVFNNANLGKFLGFEGCDFKKFKADFALAIQEIKDYLFGASESSPGLFNSLFGGIPGTLKDKVVAGLNSVLDTIKANGIFVSLGEQLIKGIAAAKDALYSIAEFIADKIGDVLKRTLGIYELGNEKNQDSFFGRTYERYDKGALNVVGGTLKDTYKAGTTGLDWLLGGGGDGKLKSVLDAPFTFMDWLSKDAEEGSKAGENAARARRGVDATAKTLKSVREGGKAAEIIGAAKSAAQGAGSGTKAAQTIEKAAKVVEKAAKVSGSAGKVVKGAGKTLDLLSWLPGVGKMFKAFKVVGKAAFLGPGLEIMQGEMNKDATQSKTKELQERFGFSDQQAKKMRQKAYAAQDKNTLNRAATGEAISKTGVSMSLLAGAAVTGATTGALGGPVGAGLGATVAIIGAGASAYFGADAAEELVGTRSSGEVLNEEVFKALVEQTVGADSALLQEIKNLDNDSSNFSQEDVSLMLQSNKEDIQALIKIVNQTLKDRSVVLQVDGKVLGSVVEQSIYNRDKNKALGLPQQTDASLEVKTAYS